MTSRSLAAVCLLVTTAWACGGQVEPEEKPVTRDDAIAIARKDVVDHFIVEDSLHQYSVNAVLMGDQWRVDFVLKRELGLNGGDAQYVIDASTGEIVGKRSEQ